MTKSYEKAVELILINGGADYLEKALHILEAYYDRNPNLIYKFVLKLMPDFQGMYRMFKCRTIPPVEHLFNKESSCIPFESHCKDEFVLVGRSEIRKYINGEQMSMVFANQGIVGNNNQEITNPFCECLASAVDKGKKLYISEDEGALFDSIKTTDRELEDEEYLWPAGAVVDSLSIDMEFDYLNRRYIAVNPAGDIVLVIKKWSSCYKDDRDYKGNAIPLYMGTMVFIKKAYISVLEQDLGGLQMKTYVTTISPN